MNRSCSGCTLCCRLLPVPEIDKQGGDRCRHQRTGKGCAIYADAPRSCRLWSCQWLVKESTRNLSRPDRSHYVIDVMPDFVTVVDHKTGRRTEVEAVQIWIDPHYPDAHRDPDLRAWLEQKCDERPLIALARFGPDSRGIALIPPRMNETGQWSEQAADLDMTRAHNAEEIYKATGRLFS